MPFDPLHRRFRIAAVSGLLSLGATLCPEVATAAFPPGPSTATETDGLWEPGVLAPAKGMVGRYARLFAWRKAMLKRARGKQVRAVVAVLGATTELSGEVPDDELMGFLASIERDRSRDPLLRSFARYSRAKLLERRGERGEAGDIYREEGYLLDWQVVGPFDNDNRKGHDARYGPELAPFETGQSFTGKLPLEPLAWQHMAPESNQAAYVSFDDRLRPNDRGTGYATTWVYAPRKTKAALRTGTGGPWRAFVNGEAVAGEDVYRTPSPLQDATPVLLEKGWNRVLIKVGTEDGMWGFYARLSAQNGDAIKGLRVQAFPPDDASPTHRAMMGSEDNIPVDPGFSVRSLRSSLEAAVDKPRPNPDDAVALVEFYRWVHPFGEDDQSDVRTAQKADEIAETARSAWMLALTESDQNESRKALIRGIERARAEYAAVEKAPTSAAAIAARGLLADMLLELSWRYRALGLERRAREMVAEARTIAPDDMVIELVGAAELAEDGFTLSSLAWVENMLERYPESTLLRQERASRLVDLARTREGLAILEALSKEHKGDRSVIGQRIDAHISLGEVDRALALGKALAEANAESPDAYRRLALLYDASGDSDNATVALERAIELSPQDASLHALLGTMHSRQGERDASILAFQRSLELKPQQPELRDLLAVLDKKSGPDLFTRYGVELEKVGKQATPKEWKGKDSGMLHHLVAVQVLPNGLSERLDHRVIRIVDDRGARNQAIQAIAYDPSESYVDVREARILRANGTVEEVGDVSVFSMAEAGFRMYYDQRQVQVAFAGLRPGDTVEVAFVKRDVAARNIFDDYFGDMVVLEGMNPRAHVEYVLEAPADRKLYFNQTMDKKVDGDTATYRLIRKDVSSLKPEGAMPGYSDVAEYLHVSTYETWDDVATWYWKLVEEQLVADDKIKAGVAEALAELPAGAGDRAKVAAIYRHVISKTRYVGLEFGIHGYKPYKTTDIYDRRFGDCKDKASLLKVMLAEAGIESHLVLVRTRDQGRLGEKTASLSGFNHAIAYVPKFDLYLDGTAEWSGDKELPTGDQGASVLVVKDGKGGTFTRIPFSKPGDNLNRLTRTIRIEDDGTATFQQRQVVQGSQASSWRAGFESADSRVDRLTKVLGNDWPGAQLQDSKFVSVSDVRAPVEIEATFKVPTFATAQGGGLRFAVTGRQTQLLRTFAPQKRRVHALVIGAPRQERSEITYELPRGMRFSTVPESKSIDSRHGSFSLTVDAKDGRATVKSELTLKSAEVPPEDYSAFRDFLRDVDAALGQAFEAKPQR